MMSKLNDDDERLLELVKRYRETQLEINMQTNEAILQQQREYFSFAKEMTDYFNNCNQSSDGLTPGR